MRNPWDDLVPPTGWRGFGWQVWVLIAALLLAGLYARLAPAAPRVVLDCREFAGSIALAAWARDMNADENLVGIYYRTASRHLGHDLARAIEREVRRVWQEKRPSAKAVEAAFLRCQAQLGDLGAEG